MFFSVRIVCIKYKIRFVFLLESLSVKNRILKTLGKCFLIDFLFNVNEIYELIFISGKPKTLTKSRQNQPTKSILNEKNRIICSNCRTYACKLL